jgi:chaperonin GroES
MSMLDKLRPLGDRVLIERLEESEKTIGGIIIPDAAKEKAQTGTVIATGMGKLDASGKVVPMNVKTGDVVYFGKYAGTEVSKERLIVREDEILGVVEK